MSCRILLARDGSLYLYIDDIDQFFKLEEVPITEEEIPKELAEIGGWNDYDRLNNFEKIREFLREKW